MIKTQIYSFSVQEEQISRPTKFKRFILWVIGLRPDEIYGFKSEVTVNLLIDGFRNYRLLLEDEYNKDKMSEKCNIDINYFHVPNEAVSTNKYGETQYWDIIKIERSRMVIRSKKAIRFCGFGDINDVGYINCYRR